MKQGIKALLTELKGDPQALETACLSVITFNSTARQISPLTELMLFKEPELTAGGATALVNPQCKNREAAAELLRSVCISGSMDTSSQDTTVIPGNRAKFAAMQPIELPQLGGQDIGKVYLEVMDSVPPLTGKNSADRILSDNFHAFMLGYLNGDLGGISITEAVDQYCGQF